MNAFDYFNRFSLKPMESTGFNFKYNMHNNFSINVQKIVKISLIDANEYLNNLHSKIPHHSQR